jgi:hypothetical protein
MHVENAPKLAQATVARPILRLLFRQTHREIAPLISAKRSGSNG